MYLSPIVPLLPASHGPSSSQSESSASGICLTTHRHFHSPFLNPFQYESLLGIEVSSLAGIWVHLPTHARLQMSHSCHLEEDSHPVISPKGPQPSDDLASVACCVNPHNIHGSKEPQHPILNGGKVVTLGLLLWITHLQIYQSQLHVLLPIAGAIQQLPSTLSMTLSSSLWVAIVLCDFPCGDMSKHIFITERVLMTEQRKDST